MPKKKNLLWQLYHKVFCPLGWNLVYCWDFLVWWTSYSLILSHPFNIQLREPICVALLKQYFTIGLYSDIYRLISFTLGLMIGTTVSSTFWCLHGWPWPSFRVKLYEKSKTLVPIFSDILLSIEMKFSLLLWFVEGHAIFWDGWCLHKYCSRERTLLTWFYSVLCLDTCEQICFKLGMMLDTTRLYSFIPAWMTLMFTQGHRFTRKLELL